jgi:asparagine synthase (glutamine-hydrolysing)
MCGIAGMMMRDGSPADAALLDRMLAALGHRGPDGEGRWVDGPVGLAQARLAIIDLATGDQPLFEPGRAPGDGAVLVANGEIYNYLELRRALGETIFATRSDCEPPLLLYRQDGADFADGLRGMYAIALYDPASASLHLARDPFGIKPLYYCETERGLAFASEPQALLAAGVVPRAEAAAPRDALLALQFTTGRATIFAGINRVLPGETVTVRQGRIAESRRRAALPAPVPPITRDEEALTALDAALADSIDVHCRADVPYGLFLSGGVDSALVLSYMAARDARPVHAFTAGFAVPGAADEREPARRLARSVGAEHQEVAFDERDFWTLLPRVAAAMDDPAADYACLPSYKLAALAARSVKVVLSGEGGDEMFAGYGRYRRAMRPRWLGGRRAWHKSQLAGLGLLRSEPTGWDADISAAERAEEPSGRSPLQAAQAVDCAEWLPNDLLLKLDRCLMAHGLEGRTPFLDPAIARIAFALADRLKIDRRQGKLILRRLLAQRLPQAASATAPKQGFTVPVAHWIFSRGRELGPLVANQPAVAALCRPDRVTALFAAGGKRQGFAAWTLLFYALWHRRHVLGKGGDGDVFELLEATIRG